MRTWIYIPAASLIALSLGWLNVDAAEPIAINGLTYETWSHYLASDEFRANGMRCATRASEAAGELARGAAADCAMTSTNPAPEYDPGATYMLDVVVHVITNTSGSAGDVSDALIDSQIDILNEDFLALAGTNGANGNDAAIQFRLATEDPSGSPTNGITRSANTNWYNDNGTYYNSLAWDPDRYVNVYTNLASGALGYVPNLPQGGIVGNNSDRIVVLWSSFGRNAPIGPPYDQGRTLTHEMGHYLGLWHPFDNGCGSVANCNTTGDFICDTNPESSPTGGCPLNRTTCSGQQAPKENYMDYSGDLCMEWFTVEQVRRMRCTMEFWRTDLSPPGVVGVNESLARTGARLLMQNEPNPFNASTLIRFELPSSGPVSLQVVDVTGRSVRTLLGGVREAGRHAASWDGRDARNVPVAAGVYFYRLQTEQGGATRRMVKVD